jgi:hypothetical protein
MSENGSQEKRQKRAGEASATPSGSPPDQFASGYDFLLLNQDLTDMTFAWFQRPAATDWSKW